MDFKKLGEMLNKTAEDKELFYGYQANIAMCVYDVLRARKKGKQYLTNKELIEACNQGASNFLQMWDRINEFSKDEGLPTLPPIK